MAAAVTLLLKSTPGPRRQASGGAARADAWVLAGLVAATFLSLLHYLAFSPLLPAIAADLVLDIGQLGQMPAAIGLGAAAFGLVAGPFADRYGKRRTLLMGLTALVASAAGLAFLPGPAMLPLVAVLAGIGRAIVYPLSLAIASAEYEGDNQIRAVSRITSSLGIAPIVGVPLVASIAAAFDWRAAWLALAIVTALAHLCLWQVFRAQPPRAARTGPRPATPNVAAAYGLLIRHKPSVALLGGTFMMGAGGWTVWTYLGAFVVQRHGFTTQEAGWAWVVVGLGLFAGSFLTGGKLGGLRLDAVFGVAAVGAGLCLGLAFVLPISGWLAVGLVGAGTLLHAATQVVTATSLPHGAPTGRATTMTVRGAASSLGAGAGAAAGGLLLQGADFATLGAGAFACCAIAAALVWWGRTSTASATEHHAALVFPDLEARPAA